MTYTADDFKKASFAKHPDGRVACKPGADSPWINPHPSDASERTNFFIDEVMARLGWVPVQESTLSDRVDLFNAQEHLLMSERHRKELAAKCDQQAQEIRRLGKHPRSLTPDDITDEMRDRARKALRDHDILGSLVPKIVHQVLTAAFTEPPARPEGAEEIEAMLEPWGNPNDGLDSMQIRSLANHLARRVRVVGSES